MPSAAPSKDRPVAAQTSFRFRCFAYTDRSTGRFVAECIDLDLMVKARKANTATRELRDAVLGYVRVAVESGQDAALIPRLAPLTHRIHYQAVAIASRMSLLGGDRLFDCTPTTPARCYA
jgi:hypothetical protein